VTHTPPQPDVLQQALAAHARGKFDEAASLCRAMLAQNPGRFDLWHFLAIVEAERGQHLEAVDAYDRSISLQPSDPTAHFNRAKSLQALQRWSEAVASYDAALLIRPAFAQALNNRGNALQQLDRFDEAVASYDAALSIQPAFAQALNNRGNALQQLNRSDDAVASYDAALAVEPNYAEAWTNRGNAWQRVHRTNEALASYDAALSIRPDYAEAHFFKAHCKLRMGDFESGWDAYEWRWDTAAQRCFRSRRGMDANTLPIGQSWSMRSKDSEIRFNSADMYRCWQTRGPMWSSKCSRPSSDCCKVCAGLGLLSRAAILCPASIFIARY
jgi:tetratricopeptide (TPR) repeat protein